jgi:hypothetical protein
VCGSLVFAGAATADDSAPRQTVIVECSDGCDTVLPALRRLGGEIASHDARTGRVTVRIATERLPEVPMLKGVRGAFKDPAGAAPMSGSRTASRRRAPGERRREIDVAAGAGPRLIAPGKGLTLQMSSSRQVRTARTPGNPEAVQRSVDVSTATAEGVVAQNGLVPVLVEVPPGTRELSFVLLWENDSRDDVDLIVLKPDGNAELAGVTLRTPERAIVKDPEPGVWTAFVNGFAMNGRTDQWQLGIAADGILLPSR